LLNLTTVYGIKKIILLRYLGALSSVWFIGQWYLSWIPIKNTSFSISISLIMY